ncbi:MAG TPA: serine/threonine-protein kinase, partial [Kofleriaceae bacterium]
MQWRSRRSADRAVAFDAVHIHGPRGHAAKYGREPDRHVTEHRTSPTCHQNRLLSSPVSEFTTRLTLESARSHNPRVVKAVAEVGSTANRYQILAKLAVGGMAEIFLTRGAGVAGVAGVERYCVLKRILREHASDAQFVQMFLDEARLAAQLQHPNIAQVYDIGMLGDSYFFTMEYVHGETVRSLLSRALELGRPLPLACVLTIIAGTAAGLHHAHERNGHDGRPLGIVHRDVTPSNLMVSFEGNVKVVDFGVAKASDREAQTKSGTVKGKISYLSPEQCRGVRVDRRSDLFSLGIVMWEMLTCARLYRRDSDFETMTAIVKEPPPPPSSHRRDVPRAVDDIVLRLLAKSVTDRFQTAADVIEAIENVSARAGTILSTSAVSRLIRDLFGTRPEPWLVLDGDTQPLQPITLGAKPIPKQLAPADGDSAEIELAAVPDLSSSSISTDNESDAPVLPDAAAQAAGAAETDPELPPARTVNRSHHGPVESIAPAGHVRPPQRGRTFGPASMMAPMTLRSLPPPPRATATVAARPAAAARAPAAVSTASPERPAAPVPVRVEQP